MTMTLAHPAAEDLGRFVDGTLDDAGRAAVVAHIADCDECRIVVVDSAEFVEPVIVHSQRKWWLTTAATIAIAISGSGLFIWNAQRNPMGGMIKTSAVMTSRLIEARLSDFRFVAKKRTLRGSVETDSEAYLLREKALEVLQRRGDDPEMQHAKGVAHLVVAQTELAEISADAGTDTRKDLLEAARREAVSHQNAAIDLLQKAAIRVRNNAGYRSDLAAALIATGTPANLKLAVDACDQALRIDDHSSEALFNRAVALKALPDPKKAIAAFKLYLTVDSSSPWADEARTNINDLKESL
jgi:tetratricopeptide (TPR) repeat protein